MSKPDHANIHRRTFVQTSGLAAGGALLGQSGLCHAAEDRPVEVEPDTVAGPLARRTLGRTGQSITTMTLGTAPCGLCPKIHPPEIAKIVTTALDLGITSIDTAPAYKQSEEGIGLALGQRRKDVFLATKVLAKTVEEAEKSLTNSFRLLRTDWIDLVYYHSVGVQDVQRAMLPGGVFNWLVKQKKAGKFRYLGISGHNRPGRFLPLLETDQVDVLLAVINFVDQHTYRFEEKVLPVARKHNAGIVAMKVFGGASRRAGSYENPKAPPELDLKYLDQAIGYALSVPGVATANLGAHNVDQVRKNVAMVRAFKRLSGEQQRALAQLGKQLAGKWGDHFGPVA